VGRLASLLEVGTGFHPELTGRENIYLNGAILGMTRAEINRKFEEIVAFAEVEKFLDTPVKRFSSGMYVRLAFAVAAHLEPEVLVVDEVLAVGDVEFQKKCLGKMEEVAGRGRTVLMVSHNTHAVRALCKSAITLDAGRLLFFGDTDKAIRIYDGSSATHQTTSTIMLDNKPRSLTRDPRIRLTAIHQGSVATFGLPYSIGIDVEVAEPISSVVFGVGFCSTSGVRVLSSDSDYSGASLFNLASGKYRINCAFESLPLAPGEYLLDVGCRSSGLVLYDEVKGAFLLEVVPPQNASPQFLHKYSTCVIRSEWDMAK
jgi:lipopolysaccharide transport system ATP-binding protein